MSSTTFNTIQNPVKFIDLNSTLEPSTIPGVMKPKYTIIHVQKSEWKECLAELEEACAVKWTIYKSNKMNNELVKKGQKKFFSELRKCHRADNYVSVAAKRIIQKETKKCNCKAMLKIECSIKYPSVFTFTFREAHSSHVPGDRKTDLRFLPLARARLNEIKERFLSFPSLPSRQLRIEILRDMDRYNRLNERKVNYFDIYNIMTHVSNNASVCVIILY